MSIFAPSRLPLFAPSALAPVSRPSPSPSSSAAAPISHATKLRNLLEGGNFASIVRLPEGEDLSEWLAVNCVDFFNSVNLVYGCIAEFCSEESCAIMGAGAKYEYHWNDPSDPSKKSVALSAPAYVDALMNWIQSIISNPAIFPTSMGAPFPPSFENVARNIIRRLFRVFAHIYNHHFEVVCALNIEQHLNTNYRHFILFVNEFGLMDKSELGPLADMNEAILSQSQ